jgi:hypothetical protein
MNLGPEQHMVVVKLASDWEAQLLSAYDRLFEACGGELPQRFADAQPKDPAAFSSFVEAYYALSGGKVAADIVRLAGLVPVDQAIADLPAPGSPTAYAAEQGTNRQRPLAVVQRTKGNEVMTRTKTAPAVDENLAFLVDAYDALYKAGRISLSKAYLFGQLVNVLVHSQHYTRQQLADAIGKSVGVIDNYGRLFRKYPNEHALLHMADEMGTFDVSILSGRAPVIPQKWIFRCSQCGSRDTIREKADEPPKFVPDPLPEPVS